MLQIPSFSCVFDLGVGKGAGCPVLSGQLERGQSQRAGRITVAEQVKVEVLEGISAAAAPLTGPVLVEGPTTRGGSDLIKDNSELRLC